MDRRQFLTTGAVVGSGVAAGILTACTTTPERAVPSSSPTTTPPTTTNAGSDPAAGPDLPQGGARRVLLAYFSRPGENYYYGDRIDLQVGNTQVVADMIAAATAVQVFRIEAADPYPQAYDQTVARNVQEEQDDARPAISAPLPDITGYDTVLLGSPVWNSQTPMIMRTFVEGVDLAGKTLHPFVTYAVSGIGRVDQDYTRLCPDSTIGENLAVQGEEAAQAGPDVQAWLDRIGL